MQFGAHPPDLDIVYRRIHAIRQQNDEKVSVRINPKRGAGKSVVPKSVCREKTTGGGWVKRHIPTECAGGICARRERGGLNSESFIPSGVKISFRANTPSDSPVSRSTISPSNMNPRSEYSICLRGSGP